MGIAFGCCSWTCIDTPYSRSEKAGCMAATTAAVLAITDWLACIIEVSGPSQVRNRQKFLGFQKFALRQSAAIYMFKQKIGMLR